MSTRPRSPSDPSSPTAGTAPDRRQFLASGARAAAGAVCVAGLGPSLAACGGDGAAETAAGGAGGTKTGADGTGGGQTAAGETGAGAGTSGAAGTSPTPTDTRTRFTFAEYPELGQVGGAAMVKMTDRSIAVVRTGATSAAVLDATCPHQGCTVGALDASAKTFTCPCHGSVFAEDGTLRHGPAATGLTSFPATVESADISAAIS